MGGSRPPHRALPLPSAPLTLPTPSSPKPDSVGSARESGRDFADNETTSDFVGMVSMMQPGVSWVARWHGMSFRDEDRAVVNRVAGLYAVTLPGEDLKVLHSAGGEDDEYEDEGEEEGVELDEDAEEAKVRREEAAEGWGGGGRGRRGGGADLSFPDADGLVGGDEDREEMIENAAAMGRRSGDEDSE